MAAVAVADAEPETEFSCRGLGVKFSGKCVACGGFTQGSDYHKSRTMLVKRPNGKFGVAHPECIGGRVKNLVGGRGLRYDGPTSFRCVDKS